MTSFPPDAVALGSAQSASNSARNEYLVLENNKWIALTAREGSSLGWGGDYYAEIFRRIEQNACLQGLTFYLCKETPEALPSYGDRVVLVVVGDEHYRSFPYFLKILAILRCYGDRPHYLDNFPTNRVQLAAVALFLFKLLEYTKGLWHTTHFRRAPVKSIHRKTLPLPLGYFGIFDQEPSKFCERQIDYAFLGSIDFRKHRWYSPLRLFKQPKFVARSKMRRVLQSLLQSRPNWKGKVDVTDGFDDSVRKQDVYAAAMNDCKISICPRGSNHETYRWYESCKMGCVIVSEPIPAAWFHEEHPALVVKDWSELPRLLDELLANDQELERLSAASLNFWESHLNEGRIAKKIEEFLGALLDDATKSVAGFTQTEPKSRLGTL